ncbi:peptide chain release factor N(5)-glutamine methyltransferase [Salinisphaera sp. T31B1]|uniref:peptide chain release factor N(5)-glutamine methyltransferase n=1 Tax=Salinisphaera sp. T31B1 TaxID=727963 RepID=UPI0033405F14
MNRAGPDEPVTRAQARLALAHRLAAVSDTPDLEARWLLQHVLGLSDAQLIIAGDRPLAQAEQVHLAECAARRLAGEPLAYVLGRVGFWSLDLAVTPDVLIPRPDTETLVETVLARLPADRPLQIVDLGTGSGAVALALARERPHWRLTATDRSDSALSVARGNAARLGLGHVTFAAGDWFGAIEGRRFQAIVSNPPYIAEGDAHLPALAHEPLTALVAKDNGMADLATLAAGAAAHLEPGGWLLVEHGLDQGHAARQLFRNGQLSEVATVDDLAGRPRVTVGRRVGSDDTSHV